MSRLNNRYLLLALRVVIGGFFAFAGFMKVIRPWQEFAAQVRGYEIVGGVYADLIAQVLPWFQLIFGLLLLVGLLPRISLAAATGQLLFFIPVVASVIIRGIPLDDCGCFGSIGIQETPPVVLVRDSVLLVLSIPLWLQHLRNSHAASKQ